MEIVLDGVAGEKYTAPRLSATFIAPFAGEIIVGGAEINRAQTSLPELPLPAHEARTIGGPKEIQSRRSVFRITLKLSTTAPKP